MNSFAATIYKLARERFAQHESRKETWILGVNNSVGESGLKKFSDGEFTIASIPALDHEREGICLYVSHYNALNVRKADQLVMEGKYDVALRLLTVIRRFGNCAPTDADDVPSRIQLVQELISGKDKDSNVRKLSEMTIEHGPSVFEMLESKPALKQTNLFEIKLD